MCADAIQRKPGLVLSYVAAKAGVVNIADTIKDFEACRILVHGRNITSLREYLTIFGHSDSLPRSLRAGRYGLNRLVRKVSPK
jgi:hypothetical protein